MSRIDPHPGGGGGGGVRNECIVFQKIKFLDRTSFVARRSLRPLRDRFEMQDHNEQYRNDCTWIVLYSVCSTSSDVRIELSRRCVRISLRCG